MRSRVKPPRMTGSSSSPLVNSKLGPQVCANRRETICLGLRGVTHHRLNDPVIILGNGPEVAARTASTSVRSWRSFQQLHSQNRPDPDGELPGRWLVGPASVAQFAGIACQELVKLTGSLSVAVYSTVTSLGSSTK